MSSIKIYSNFFVTQQSMMIFYPLIFFYFNIAVRIFLVDLLIGVGRNNQVKIFERGQKTNTLISIGEIIFDGSASGKR